MFAYNTYKKFKNQKFVKFPRKNDSKFLNLFKQYFRGSLIKFSLVSIILMLTDVIEFYFNLICSKFWKTLSGYVYFKTNKFVLFKSSLKSFEYELRGSHYFQ